MSGLLPGSLHRPRGHYRGPAERLTEYRGDPVKNFCRPASSTENLSRTGLHRQAAGVDRRGKIQFDTWYDYGYTQTMKTAISIPDKLFRAADQFAKNHGFSRSRLFAEAVAQYLEQHPSGHITKQLDDVYSSEPAKLDEALSKMQLNSIEKEEWE
jgi:hypothetical protein